MKKHKHMLTGEGFTLEEADEILRDQKPLPPQSKEERDKELAFLRQAAERWKAYMAADEADDVIVTREDLEREMKRQRAAQAPEEPK